jgi:hypothetical protein
MCANLLAITSHYISSHFETTEDCDIYGEGRAGIILGAVGRDERVGFSLIPGMKVIHYIEL